MKTDIAQLVAVFVQATLYGVYLVTFGFCFIRYLRSNAGWRPLRRVDWPILTVATVLWVSSTINLALGMVRITEALILKPDVSTMWIGAAKTVTTGVLVIVADSMMVWRFWVIYQKSLVATLAPAILWCGCLAMSIWSPYLQMVHTTPGPRENTGVLVTSSKPLTACTAFWVLTLVLNIYTTVAIVLRIWRVERETKNAFQSSDYKDCQLPKDTTLHKTMRMIIDSGFIYSLVSIAVFVSQLLLSNAIFITSAIDIIVIGLTFNLIALRVVARHRREEALRTQQPHGTFEQSSINFITPASPRRPSFISENSISTEDSQRSEAPSAVPKCDVVSYA